MAHIRMKYLFIKKDNGENDKNIKEIVYDFLTDNFGVDKTNCTIEVSDDAAKLEYVIQSSQKSKRCFLDFTCDVHIRNASKAVDIFNKKLQTTASQKFFQVLKLYDGLSEYYCEKLYPRYARYERKLRHMVLLMVTNAYGKNWIEDTFDEEMRDDIQKNARKGIANISMETPLEYLDLGDLEDYLFRPKIDIEKMMSDLTDEQLKKMERDELYDLIDDIKNPKCLWERVFNDVGDKTNWENSIKNVHNTRNSVAHHNTVNIINYNSTVKDLKIVESMLDNAIETIMKQELDNTKQIAILGSFAALVGAKLFSIYQTNAAKELVTVFSRRVKELVKPIEKQLQVSTLQLIKSKFEENTTLNMDGINNYTKAFEKLNKSIGVDTRMVGNQLKLAGENLSNYQINALEISNQLEETAKEFQKANIIYSELKDSK